jgi:hypothetical protein
MQITSKPRSGNPSEMSFAGILNGRCHTNFYSLQGFGIKDEIWEVIAVE